MSCVVRQLLQMFDELLMRSKGISYARHIQSGPLNSEDKIRKKEKKTKLWRCDVTEGCVECRRRKCSSHSTGLFFSSSSSTFVLLLDPIIV